MPETSGPDAQLTSVEITDNSVETQEHKSPGWVYDADEADRVWSAYNDYLRGRKVRDIAVDLNIGVRTVYKYIEEARAEVPYHVASRASELMNIRMQWVQMAWKTAEDIQNSQLRLDRKAEQISKLMNATGAWLTAVEELSGARRGTGSRLNLHLGEGSKNQIIFDMDSLMKIAEGESPPTPPAVLDVEAGEESPSD